MGRSSWLRRHADDFRAVFYGVHHDAAGPDEAPRSDMQALDNGCACPDVRFIADDDAAGQRHPRRQMYVSPDAAVVIHRCAGVDKGVFADRYTRLYHRAGHDLDAFTEFHASSNNGPRVDAPKKSKPGRPELFETRHPKTGYAYRPQTVRQPYVLGTEFREEDGVIPDATYSQEGPHLRVTVNKPDDLMT